MAKLREKLESAMQICRNLAPAFVFSGKYDYRAALYTDILDWLRDDLENAALNCEAGTLADYIDEAARCVDAVTGGASGSYTLNTWRAEENICHNLDLAAQAADECGANPAPWNAEAVDVMIRGYLLGEVGTMVVSDLETVMRAADLSAKETESITIAGAHRLTAAMTPEGMGFRNCLDEPLGTIAA